MDYYIHSDDISENHVVATIDIEVESTKGFPEPDKAKNPITSISIHDSSTNTCYAFILDKEKRIDDYDEEDHIITNDKQEEVLKVNLSVRSFPTEEDLLEGFLELYRKINPTILTGWNIEQFDMPYLYHRLIKVLGDHDASILSKINLVHFSKQRNRYFFAGVSILDYYNLYKRFTFSEEPSYTLDYIGTKKVNLGKIKYGTSIDNLYNTNIKLFLEYNIRDVVIVLLINEKFKFISLTQGICHKCHVPYEDVFMPSKFLEGAILTYMRRNNIVCPVKKEHKINFVLQRNHNSSEKYIEVDEIPKETISVGFLKLKKTTVKGEKVIIEYGDIDYQRNRFILKKPLGFGVFSKGKEVELFFTGAFVKYPEAGLHEWVYDMDATGMYPGIIMSLNISIETKVAKIIDWNVLDFVKKTKRDYTMMFEGKTSEKKIIDSDSLYNYLTELKLSVSPNGVLYKTKQKGLIPILLEGWKQEREDYRKLETKFGDKKNKEYNKEKYEYFSRLQAIIKVFQNSLYGVLGLSSFRFFDMDNAAATTSTGYEMINFAQKVANVYYNKQLNTKDKDYVIYGDTDSLFLKLIPFFEQKFGKDYKKIDEEILFSYSLEKIKEVQSQINSKLDNFAKHFLNIDNHLFSVKQELIAERGFWFDVKKRYALKVVWEKGFKLSEPRYDYKGIEIVRSDFPKAFREFYKLFMNSLLDGNEKSWFDKTISDFYKDMKKMDILDLCKPTSCSDISFYQKLETEYSLKSKKSLFGERAKGAPAHIKAALNYNDLLRYHKLDKKFELLKNGAKVRWTYLKQNTLNIETIAIKGYEDPDKILDFVKENIDHEKNFDNILKNKIEDIFRIQKWGDIPNEKYSKLSKFFRVK